MKTQTYKATITLAAALLLSACGADISDGLDDDAEAGTADFSTFVAVGDSLTAGYKDGALYRAGQQTSFPAILAQQFALAGGGAFSQPLMPVNATGSLTIATNPIPGTRDRLVLVPTGNPSQPVAPVSITPGVSTEVGLPPLVGPFNNLGVPAAKSFHVPFSGYGNVAGLAAMPPTANPFFVRFASDPANSMLQDAMLQNPTFFVLWIGNNDILLWALDGGDPTVSGQAITPTGTFDGAFAAIVGGLTVNPNTKGVLITIPEIATIPYFTTVPYNAIPLGATQAADANAGFSLYNLGMQAAVAGGLPCGITITAEEAARRTITFQEGQNPIVILDEDLTDLTSCFGASVVNMRQATAADFILLPAASKLGTDNGVGGIWGVSAPLLDADVLKESEAEEVEVARTAYNATIEAAANVPHLLLYDAAARLRVLNESGINYGSGGVSATFVQGGFFSADGVHPTARGYAVVANEIMDVIEAGFGAKLPPVDPGQYSTVFFQ